MVRNYLKGVVGDAINVMLAAAAMNFKRIQINPLTTDFNAPNDIILAMLEILGDIGSGHFLKCFIVKAMKPIIRNKPYD